DRSPPRVCENPQEPTSWRIVFSIALFPIAATALFLLRLAKSRRIFYAQIECLCFRTGCTPSRPPAQVLSVRFYPLDSQRGLQRRPVVFEVGGWETGYFRRFVPAPYADGVFRKGQSLELGNFLGGEGAALQRKAAHRARRETREISGIGRAKVALCRDVQPHRFGHGRTKGRQQVLGA